MLSKFNSTPQVIYLHGLNTFGDDDLHIGPLRLGRMDQHVKASLLSCGINVYSVDRIGFGSPEEQAKIAFKTITSAIDNKELDANTPISLLGHSAGGLTARVLAHQLSDKIRIPLVVTWGSPHHGIAAFETIENLKIAHPLAFKAAQAIGMSFHYDLQKKATPFVPFSIQESHLFNKKYPSLTSLKEVSFPCAVPARHLSAGLWPLYPWTHQSSYTKLISELISRSGYSPSDGIVPLSSQKWGQIGGYFALDHLAQIGFFNFHTPKRKQLLKNHFEELMKTIAVEVLHIARINVPN